MKSSKKSLVVKIILIFCSLLISYLVGEVLVYSVFRDKIVLFPRYVSNVNYGKFRIRRNIPNSHYFHKSVDGSWEFTINSKGFRSNREFSYTKPKDTLRVLTLGDSFTIGYEVRQQQTYSAVIEKYLKKNGRKVEVINAGVSGFGNAEELVFFEQEGVRYSPDVVILGFYKNDFKDNMRSNLYRVEGGKVILNKNQYLPAVGIRNFLNSFFIYRWLSEHSYLHNFMNMLATSYVKHLVVKNNTSELSKKNIVIDTGYEDTLSIELIRRVYSVAKENNIKFILLDIPERDTMKQSFPDLPTTEYNNLCDAFLSSKNILRDYHGVIELNVPHGHRHWSEFSHALVGKKLGDMITEMFYH